MIAGSWPGRRSLAGMCLLVSVFLASSLPVEAAVVTGTVTSPLGVPIPSASVALIESGKIIAHTLSGSDGSFQLTSSAKGRFYVLASAGTFKQVTTESFYAGPADARQENIVLEPSPVRQEVVISATRTPTPQAQLSSSVSVQRNQDFVNRTQLVDPLRQVPGVFLVQQGQFGGLTSLYVRGGNSDSNQVNLDGNSIDDIGGVFDFSDVATMGIEKFELYRGSNSTLYGSDAASSVVNLSTPRGSTSFPSFFFDGDYGNLTSFRDQFQVGGTYKKIDYYGGFSGFQSDNNLPMNKYHDYTPAANLAYSLSAGTQIRVTARNSVSAVGVPGAFDFYGIADAAKRSDQDTYLTGTIDNQTSPAWHNMVSYGLTRKREENKNFYPAGIPIPTTVNGFTTTNYYGFPSVIKGANGYSLSGQAVLNYAGVYPNTLESVSDRDQLYFQSNYQFTQHIVGLFGFRFEDERGAEKSAAYGMYRTLERANYDYSGQIQGNFRNRVYYTFGGGVEKNDLFGTVGTPHIGLVYYPDRPGKAFRGTKLKVDYANGYSEPSLDDQFGSLYNFLLGQQGGSQAIKQFHISPMGAQDSRVYEAGGEQNFLSERGVVRISYFHNQYRNQVESVPVTEVPALLPNLTPSEQQQLETYLIHGSGIDLNSQSYRSQGMETEIQYTLLGSILLRGGYTYVDSVVQRSFTSDSLAPSFNTGPPGGPVPSFSALPIGNFDPLRGARPFRRPPHIGFTTVSYNGRSLGAQLTGSFVSRSDDSTFLGGADFYGGNSLLLPNRNLDYGYAKLDAEASYQFIPQIGIYAQASNLTNDQHIGPVGYPSLPFTFRIGLHIDLGHQPKQ